MDSSTHSQRPLLKRVFISPSEPRLRAGWRLAIQTFMMVALLLFLSIPFEILAVVFRWDPSSSLFFFANTILELVAFSVSVILARRFLDRRSFVSLGFKLDRQVLPDLLTGIFIPLIMMGSIYLIMAGLGWLQFRDFSWRIDPLRVVLGQVLFFFLIFVIVGFQEELLFRGYQLQTVASGTNLFWGLVISSLLFGFLHLTNPNATWISSLGIFFAGLFLALGYLWTGQLWLSIGLHIGWNFFEGVVFGFPVSGLAIYPLLRINVTGPESWTGGAFGPEAGLIVLPALALGAVLVYLYSRLRGQAAPKI
jgi:membrane protease YdiL (CAAX protease family)